MAGQPPSRPEISSPRVDFREARYRRRQRVSILNLVIFVLVDNHAQDAVVITAWHSQGLYVVVLDENIDRLSFVVLVIVIDIFHRLAIVGVQEGVVRRVQFLPDNRVVELHEIGQTVTSMKGAFERGDGIVRSGQLGRALEERFLQTFSLGLVPVFKVAWYNSWTLSIWLR
jgi:hypothetical protein